MSILALTSDTLIGTAAAGNIEYNGQFFGTDSNASRAQLQRIVRATAVASTSGTSIDFTGIPAWVEKITVMFNGTSLSGTSNILVQLGDSGGIENTGYQGASLYLTSAVAGAAANSAGFIINVVSTAAQVTSGNLFINLLDTATNTWSASGVFGSTGTNTAITLAGGAKSLSATLDRVRITTVNGTDTFDAGSVNIIYEG
jgi:hypothetical protein